MDSVMLAGCGDLMLVVQLQNLPKLQNFGAGKSVVSGDGRQFTV